MDQQRMRSATQSLAGITFKEWQAIERQVNYEFKRLANQNTFSRTDYVTKNVFLDLADDSDEGESMKNPYP